MTDGVIQLWNVLKSKIVVTIKDNTKNCVRRSRFEVVNAPNGTTMAVKQPYGNTVNLPYSPTVAGARAGDAVYVKWSGTLSTGYVYAYGDGMEKSGVIFATVGTTWTQSGTLYTQTVPTIGMKSDYYPRAELSLSGLDDAAEIEAWGHIKHIAAGVNSITVYADTAIATSINIALTIF